MPGAQRPRMRVEPTEADPGRGTGAISGPLPLALAPAAPLSSDPESTSKEMRPGAGTLSGAEIGPTATAGGGGRRNGEERPITGITTGRGTGAGGPPS
ncbi:hypothetical protein NDU88_008648 [Pleurodeles waltl]|uniref:Uncharacterized protein n=1 Tax=Pleurodeles waltl TaxID=8319 RepID=A0AAV7PTP6_PLEWA|nr:hypothetical protein NDU88_008648 [Pleurodeles waltl]